MKDIQKTKKNKKTKTHLRKEGRKNPVIRNFFPTLSYEIASFLFFLFFSFVSCGLSDQRKKKNKKNFKKQRIEQSLLHRKVFPWRYIFSCFCFVNSSTFSFSETKRGTREKFNLKQHMPLKCASSFLIRLKRLESQARDAQYSTLVVSLCFFCFL